MCRSDDQEGSLALCDGCDNACHTFCAQPRLESVPTGPWFCSMCRAKTQAGDTVIFTSKHDQDLSLQGVPRNGRHSAVAKSEIIIHEYGSPAEAAKHRGNGVKVSVSSSPTSNGKRNNVPKVLTCPLRCSLPGRPAELCMFASLGALERHIHKSSSHAKRLHDVVYAKTHGLPYDADLDELKGITDAMTTSPHDNTTSQSTNPSDPNAKRAPRTRVAKVPQKFRAEKASAQHQKDDRVRSPQQHKAASEADAPPPHVPQDIINVDRGELLERHATYMAAGGRLTLERFAGYMAQHPHRFKRALQKPNTEHVCCACGIDVTANRWMETHNGWMCAACVSMSPSHAAQAKPSQPNSHKGKQAQPKRAAMQSEEPPESKSDYEEDGRMPVKKARRRRYARFACEKHRSEHMRCPDNCAMRRGVTYTIVGPKEGAAATDPHVITATSASGAEVKMAGEHKPHAHHGASAAAGLDAGSEMVLTATASVHEKSPAHAAHSNAHGHPHPHAHGHGHGHGGAHNATHELVLPLSFDDPLFDLPAFEGNMNMHIGEAFFDIHM